MGALAKVLVTGGGTATALSVLKGLRLATDLPTHVVLGDPSSDIAGKHLADEYVELPLANADGYADDLLAIARDLGVQLVVPVFDGEFAAVADARQQFDDAGIRLAISSPDAIRQCRDKRQTLALFERLGVAFPRTYSAGQALSLAGDAYPLFVKPADGRGSLDTFRVGDRTALAQALAAVHEPIIQECVEGDGIREVTIDTMSNATGVLLGCSPRYRDETKAGQSYKGVTFQSDAIADACRRICEALPIEGPACLQCFDTPSGPQFIEVNPRFGAATILSITAGFNGPRFLVEETLGRTPTPLSARPGVRMLRYWQEVFVDVE